MSFERLGLLPEIISACDQKGWTHPTEIQDEAIPLVLGGGDVLMAAETGRGKTGAFSLPVVQIVAETMREMKKPAKASSSSPTATQSSPANAKSNSTAVRMSVVKRESDFAVDGSGLLCQSRRERDWQGGRATHGAVKGKHYYEVEMTDEGLCRVGWATPRATYSLGTDNQGFGFGGTGKKSFSRNFETYGEPFGLGDVVGCYLDRDTNSIAFSKNGKHLGCAYKIPTSLHKAPLIPACTLKNAELKFNFSGPFKHAPEDGFAALSTQSDVEVVSTDAMTGASGSKTANMKAPMALIIEPSRELAEQTRNIIREFAKELPDEKIRDCLLIGGVNAKDQIRALNGGAQVVVGTPGRVEEFVKSKHLSLERIRFFIIDEIDALLSQGNEKLLSRLYESMPVETDGNRLQLIVCSATLHHPAVKKFAEKHMYHPSWVDLKGLDSVPETVHHTIVKVDPKTDTLWHSLKGTMKTDGVHARDNTGSSQKTQEAYSEAIKMLKFAYVKRAIDTHNMDQAILFCRTRLDCDNLEAYLASQAPRGPAHPYSCVCLHGSKGRERQENLDKFKNGEVRLIICTDVAARGLDIQGIPYVINVTLPDEKENYIHRIGRVGRAKRMGLAISLVATLPEKVWYHTCKNRGQGCANTKLKENGGCTIWYNEPELLVAIQEHLGEVISETPTDFNVPINEFDGKVVYGEVQAGKKAAVSGHAHLLAPSVRELAELENSAQTSFLTLKKTKQ